MDVYQYGAGSCIGYMEMLTQTYRIERSRALQPLLIDSLPNELICLVETYDGQLRVLTRTWNQDTKSVNWNHQRSTEAIETDLQSSLRVLAHGSLPWITRECLIHTCLPAAFQTLEILVQLKILYDEKTDELGTIDQKKVEIFRVDTYGNIHERMQQLRQKLPVTHSVGEGNYECSTEVSIRYDSVYQTWVAFVSFVRHRVGGIQGPTGPIHPNPTTTTTVRGKHKHQNDRRHRNQQLHRKWQYKHR